MRYRSQKASGDRKAQWMTAFQVCLIDLRQTAPSRLEWVDAEYLYHQGVTAADAAKRIGSR